MEAGNNKATMRCMQQGAAARAAMLTASPSPVTRPIRAQMAWIAVISG